jgi:AraC-like DNA-binding protein
MQRIRGYTVEFTPLGAMVLFGIPQSEIANRGIEAGLLISSSLVTELVDRISAAHTALGGAQALDTILLRQLRRVEVPRRVALIEAALETMAPLRNRKLQRSIRIEDVSAELGVTTRHINREFQHALGMGPKRYILISKISQAMTRLSHAKTLDLTDLALDLGFYDYPHFSREFKKLTLASPKEFVSSQRYDEIRVVAAGPGDGLSLSS